MISNLSLNPITKAGVTLGVFAFFGVILLASVQWLTKDDIAENIRQRHLVKLHEIISPDFYDNDLLGSMTKLSINAKGIASDVKVYSVSLKEKEVAKVYEVTSLEGYSGSISMLVGVNLDDLSLRGVRIISHKETPGLGDKIETDKDDWIFKFSGKSLNNPSVGQWKVQKDGGAFDQFTGATITPRAVVNAVRESLKLATEGGTSNE
jgi:electron transport complex protein RnfG